MGMFPQVSDRERILEVLCIVDPSDAEVPCGYFQYGDCVYPLHHLAWQAKKMWFFYSCYLFLLVVRLQQPHVLFAIKDNLG